jgi:hypothetical protein
MPSTRTYAAARERAEVADDASGQFLTTSTEHLA